MQQTNDDTEAFVHHAALAGRVDVDLRRVVHQRAGADPEHGPTAGDVIEQNHAVGQNERVVVRQGGDAGAEADVACALGGDADEYFGRGNYLETAGVAFTDSGLIVAEAVEVLQQFEAAFQGRRRVFAKGLERDEEDTAA